MRPLVKGLCAAVLFCFFAGYARAEAPESFKYDAVDKVVINTQTGEVYRFIVHNGDLKHIVINYVTGVVKENRVLNASKEQELLLIKEVVYDRKLGSDQR